MRTKQPLKTSQRVVVIIMDVLLMTELCLAMYWCNRDPETMVATFLKTYLPAAMITLGGAWMTIRRLSPPEPEPVLQKGA
ncbi:MAG: hypothetical protein KUA35_15135 [Pseudodesulfovibrio sp.]|uniref:Uncharacterized protein n=1 Tax=Pseudodesulfovibrio aespoeensis (strain ATCC 700646 / DSM 10631 / Aspo-2) TaxID=643562 RepID=E6VUK7_PSEA9|nr:MULTISPECIES: hypothetical protein [Pseudodesulfovibrio]MBU4192901.1 hypothetical protein [Pseudomonadota bacterium]ADU61152.1 hypothetical protein Daes_0125 [Pseudodesulfovibrio aespoeensis Aspo-2]MBU4378756.1 hypothetical protein [Pseudomonadota bacterium]MBU4475795.1 hypothetical protein [Pseudomonadota bacterium]MBU4517416.1 hypothetical protein [Pseudomonadota bacterium]